MDTGAAGGSSERGGSGVGRKLRKSCDFCCLRKRKCDGGGGGLSSCRCVLVGRVQLVPGSLCSACFVDRCCCYHLDKLKYWPQTQIAARSSICSYCDYTTCLMCHFARARSLTAGPVRCFSPCDDLVYLCTDPTNEPSCARTRGTSPSQAIMVGWSRDTCLRASSLR